MRLGHDAPSDKRPDPQRSTFATGAFEGVLENGTATVKAKAD